MKKKVEKKYFNQIAGAVCAIDDWSAEFGGLEEVCALRCKPIKGKRLAHLVRLPGVFADRWEADGVMTTAVEAVVTATVGGGPVCRTFGGMPRFNPSGRYVIDVAPLGSGWGYRFRRVA